MRSLPTTAWDFAFEALQTGGPLPLSQFKGQVLLIVNTASHCGFTKQYKALEALYQRYREAGLIVLAVPSNDFGNQEPEDASTIASFCDLKFGVTFPMTQKVHVRGPHAHPFYVWAKTALGFGTAPKWNFHKYLVGRDGALVDYFNSMTAPDAPRVLDRLSRTLREKAAEVG